MNAMFHGITDAELGHGNGEATLVYDVHTATPVGTQRTAEFFRLRAGLIAEIRLIFDASVWRQVMVVR